MLAVAGPLQVEAPPKVKHVRRLVVDTWQNGAESAHVILWSLAKRPVMSSSVIALKVLLVIHRIMQQGPSEVLPACSKSATLMQGVESAWKDSSDGCARLAVRYASLVAAKAVFHFNFSTYSSAYVDESGLARMEPRVVAQMLDVLDNCIHAVHAAIDRMERVSGQAEELAASVALPLLKEVDMVYNASTSHTYKLAASRDSSVRNEAQSSLYKKLSDLHNRLRSLYGRASKSEPLRAAGATPPAMAETLPDPRSFVQSVGASLTMATSPCFLCVEFG